MRIILFTLSLFICITTTAQKISLQEKKYFQLLRTRFNETNAYQTVAFVEQRWRIAGNTGFNESIYHVEKILQQAGFIKDSTESSTLTYRIEKRPMKRPTWEPIDAQLYIVGDDQPLLSFRTNRNMLAINSASTPPEGVTAELIDLGAATRGIWEATNVKGKIVLAEGGIGTAYANAMKYGALGALSYSMPAYNQPSVYQHSIQFQGIGYTDSVQQRWGILLSYAARERLKAALAKGPVQLRVITQTKIYPSEELTIVANVRGSVKPNERFVFSAHVQEPGANDNATGVGTLAEMARVTAQLVKNKQLTPQRTLTFLWGDEIVSTRRYIKDDSLRAKGIKWGLSLDMVGEDTKKTGGSFLIEKMPDPSAIWTRGKDKHSEWGGGPLKESDLFPHYFNDLLLNRCRNEAAVTGWVVNTNPFEGGSDHTPFLQAKIPGLLMWHFTDAFYHTDADRLDKVSAATMKHVGVSALVTAYLLTSADTKTAVWLIDDLTRNAVQRLREERALSDSMIRNHHKVADEDHILAVWQQWYEKALDATADISVGGSNKTIQEAIKQAKKKLRNPAFRIPQGTK